MTVREFNLKGAHILANAIVSKIRSTDNFILRCEYATCGEVTIVNMVDAGLISESTALRLAKRIQGALTAEELEVMIKAIEVSLERRTEQWKKKD